MSASPARSERPVTADFVISRTFDAPLDLVWKAWTEAEQLKKWFTPKGFQNFHAITEGLQQYRVHARRDQRVDLFDKGRARFFQLDTPKGLKAHTQRPHRPGDIDIVLATGFDGRQR